MEALCPLIKKMLSFQKNNNQAISKVPYFCNIAIYCKRMQHFISYNNNLVHGGWQLPYYLQYKSSRNGKTLIIDYKVKFCYYMFHTPQRGLFIIISWIPDRLFFCWLSYFRDFLKTVLRGFLGYSYFYYINFDVHIGLN